MRKPYLSASGDYYNKQRMGVLVRDNFQCQFHKAAEFIPMARLYRREMYDKELAKWLETIRWLKPIEGICACELPQDRLDHLQTHHIIGRTNFLPHEIEGHDLSNLVTICIAHHEQIHPHMRFERQAMLKSMTIELK